MQRLPFYKSIWQVMALWPQNVPIISLCGSGRYSVLALDFSEVTTEQAEASILVKPPAAGPAFGETLPFTRGLIGVLSYDRYSPYAVTKANARIFDVKSALVFDQVTRQLFLTGEAACGSSLLAPSDIAALLKPQKVPVWDQELEAEGFKLLPRRSRENYLATCRSVLDDIASGRFYQLNLLRYFDVQGPQGRGPLLRQMARFSGPHGAFFDLNDFTMASFSPERFVCITPDEKGLVVSTRPIKGTAPRHQNPDEDQRAAVELLQSVKDRAELHMIVDLMRNDLNRICKRGSVRVTNPGSLRSHVHVHHLEAEVVGRLDEGLTLGALIAAVCPGGSITGAPKLEVMQAIREYEGCDRGYFMGHAFYLDESGRFDSSILIRTLVGTAGNSYEYAAGSGIVIGSDPAKEFTEIETKCRVITASCYPALTLTPSVPLFC